MNLTTNDHLYLDGCVVTTATDTSVIIQNIKENNKFGVSNVADADFWRVNKKVALVGGGPSLKNTLEELKTFKIIIVCGSVHDFLVENNVVADYCVLCDPDPLILNYCKHKRLETKYLIASQCDPEVFKYFKLYNTKLWHAAGDNFDPCNFGLNQPLVGGGCTVATRAMMLAYGMGYTDQHLFGMDTCLDGDQHHAYEFDNPEKEKLNGIMDIILGDDPNSGQKFKVADYMLGQLFDFRTILKTFKNRIQFTVHGGGVLDYAIKYELEKGL